MQLLDAVEAKLHESVPDFIHDSYPPGECPHCPYLVNVRKRFSLQANEIIRRAAEKTSAS